MTRKQLKTRVFEMAERYGYQSDRALADAMGITPSMVCRTRNGAHKITETFIEGALRAFPDQTLDDLFYTETEDREPALAS